MKVWWKLQKNIPSRLGVNLNHSPSWQLGNSKYTATYVFPLTGYNYFTVILQVQLYPVAHQCGDIGSTRSELVSRHVLLTRPPVFLGLNINSLLHNFSPLFYRYFPNPGNKVIEMHYQLPKDLTCRQCVFQWRYVAGNNWGNYTVKSFVDKPY